MIDNINVATTYANGTTISMDACSAKFFLTGLAVSVIAQCREMVSIESSGILVSTTNLPHYDALVDEYCSGVHGAVLFQMIQKNVQVIYKFVQDSVLNMTNAGLYLWFDKTTDGTPAWKLLTAALDEFMKLVEKRYEILGKKVPHDTIKYNIYNKEFEELMTPRNLKS